MKKRILALALAGTTAFTVFGGAMSANAAVVTTTSSTHEKWNIDRYETYTPNGNITWGAAETAETTATTNNTFYTKGAYRLDENGNVPAGTTIYMRPSTYASNSGTDIRKVLVNIKDKDSGITYYDGMTEFAKENGYIEHTFTGTDEYTKGKVKYIVAQNKDPNAATQYGLFILDDGKGGTEWNEAAQAAWTRVAGTFYIPEDLNSNGNAVYTAEQAIDLYEDELDDGEYYFIDTAGNDNDTETNLYRTAADGTAKTIVVSGSEAVDEIYSLYSRINATVGDYEDIRDVTVSNGTVYLYDYYYDDSYPTDVSADEFEYAWNHDTLAHVLEEATDKESGVIYPETGYGYRSVREEVLNAWEDFLDDLGILNLSYDGLTRWAEDLVEDYAYQYYDALVVVEYEDLGNGAYSITYESGKNLDIYNFGGLIKDILELAPVSSREDGYNTAIYNAQTSEFIYLMQQYEKYMDGYVEPIPVDTNDWGDLLVSLAQAPTAEEFATSNGYKQYSKAVDSLVSNYENASTSGELKTAEEDLYKFVTNYVYKYETKPDTAALNSAIDSTYYNYKWNGTDYAGTDYTKDVDKRAVTAGVGYYVGAFDTDGVLSATNEVDKNLTAVAFYPAVDYSGSVNDGSYPGVDAKIYNVSSEYFWFYNVYALAYDVLAGNKYQSTIDLMATTLEEAIDALVPTTSATAADVVGAEEQNDEIADLVETDYKAAMWANRNKIYNYITERVSNDETGHYGATNAEILAKEAAYYMGWQNYQTTVTRSEINSVSTAKTQAQNALTALRNDEENYNAAQANALEKAIEDCDVIIDLYNGDYSKSAKSQSVNAELALQVGDKDQILKSDITGAIQAVEDAINFKNIIQGWTKTENGWMYGVEDTYDSALTWGVEDTLEGPHYLNFGWAKIGNTWFYFDDEGIAKESDWLQVGNDWYYFNKNCGAAIGWAKVDDQWYYFNQGCKMMTGWQKVDGNWYYLKPSGAMATGWCQVDGKWYYLSTASNSLGQMYYSTTTPDGYKVDASGALVE